MIPVQVKRGAGPVILAMPHVGTHLPPGVLRKLTPSAKQLADTDWHIDRLYDGLIDGATVVRATFHRYVIDANRDPSGASLYPGQNTTGLVPLTDFDGEPLWSEPPSPAETRERIREWHAPYHAALAAEIERVKALHGAALVYDCHSIRSRIPYLFEGTLPDFNIGTDGGRTCRRDMEEAAAAICAAAPGYSHVVNGRFRGGWTTRHYGRPEENVHAIQMELAQSAYLASETPPFAYDTARAERLRVHLASILKALAALAPSPGGPK